MVQGKTNAYRIVNGEGDFSTGLIWIGTERPGHPVLDSGMERVKDQIVHWLAGRYGPSGSTNGASGHRKEEGLPREPGSSMEKRDSTLWRSWMIIAVFMWMSKRPKNRFLSGPEGRIVRHSKVAAESKDVGLFCLYRGVLRPRRDGGWSKRWSGDSSEEALDLAAVHFDLILFGKCPIGWYEGMSLKS